MGKRSCSSNPAMIEVEQEEVVALLSSKLRALQAASNTTAMSLMALRTKVPTALSEVVFPVIGPLCPPQPHRQAKVVKYSLSSITDDEKDENKINIVASSSVVHISPSLAQLAIRTPFSFFAHTTRCEVPNHRKLPFGRPLPPAPVLPSSLRSRGGIPLTGIERPVGQL
jgi:hypothetical protein